MYGTAYSLIRNEIDNVKKTIKLQTQTFKNVNDCMCNSYCTYSDRQTSNQLFCVNGTHTNEFSCILIPNSEEAYIHVVQ